MLSPIPLSISPDVDIISGRFLIVPITKSPRIEAPSLISFGAFSFTAVTNMPPIFLITGFNLPVAESIFLSIWSIPADTFSAPPSSPAKILVKPSIT